MDRRATLKWMLAATATLPLLQLTGCGDAPQPPAKRPAGKGYGTDPDLLETYAPGKLWPLILTSDQRRIATGLCNLILPDSADGPGAVAVGVVAFINEWVSAPYPRHAQDRDMILAGFTWLDAEAQRRYSRSFAMSDTAQRTAICDAICYAPKARKEDAAAAAFFARYRDLTLGGFATSPEGRKYLRYVGNVPLQRFDGPPPEVRKLVGV